jgi:hypothetical protein
MHDPYANPMPGDAFRYTSRTGHSFLRSVWRVTRDEYGWTHVYFWRDEGTADDWPISLWEKVARTSWESAR